METINDLIELLTLEKIDNHIFRGNNLHTSWGRAFGGQVLGQALHAAYQTVPDERIAHSMHAYFILAGDINIPIIYEVDTIRDGGSFTTRRVVAIQKGRPIFNMSASFQLRQEGFDHQIPMPNVLPPDVLLSDVDQFEVLKKDNPELYQDIRPVPRRILEVRPVERIDPLYQTNSQPYRHIWMKSREETSCTLQMQHQILAYSSDYNLLLAASLPHRNKMRDKQTFFASLDHALWFHRDFRVDDWLLYAIDSPSASNARGFARGSIFNQAGQLVASVAQEGLMRVKEKPAND